MKKCTTRLLSLFIFFITLSSIVHHALNRRLMSTNDNIIDSLLSRRVSPPNLKRKESTKSISDRNNNDSSSNSRQPNQWMFEGLNGTVYPPIMGTSLPSIPIIDYPPSSCQTLLSTDNDDGKDIGGIGDSGIEGFNGKAALLKIRQGMLHSQQIIRNSNQASTPSSRTTSSTTPRVPRVLCMVYTASHRHDNLRAIANTWGRQCDGFIGISNETDLEIGAIAIPHHGEESYDNMWQKLRFAYQYVLDATIISTTPHNQYSYDYYFVCGDDTYVVIDNFKSFLMSDVVHNLNQGHLDIYSQKSQAAQVTATRMNPRPLLFGRPKWDSGRARVHYMLKDGVGGGWPIFDDPEQCIWNVTGYDHFTNVRFLGQSVFPIGGPGYALNSAALELWVRRGIPRWRVNATDPREDFFLGMWFEFYGVHTSDTRDGSGLERFRTNTAEAIMQLKNIMHPTNLGKLKHFFGVEHSQKGLESVSNTTISFHLKYPTENGYYPKVNTTSKELIYRYHAILHDLCPKEGT